DVADDMDVTIWRPKLEKGTKATDWTPAPEDTDAKITHIETEFTQTFERFDQTVSSLDGRVTAQTQEIDRITSTVADSEGRISVVEQNVNGIQETVSDPVNGLVTQVSTLANGFNVLAKDFEDLEVGGRNLILDSATTKKAGNNIVYWDLSESVHGFKNKTITVSFDARSLSGNNKKIAVYFRGSTPTYYFGFPVIKEGW